MDWTPAYSGLVGQAVGYGASATYQILTQAKEPIPTLKAHVLPFLASAAGEVASAPVASLVPASPLAKTYASIATTAAATPMIWAAVRAPTSTTSPVIAIPQPAIRPSVISSAASGLASNAPLAGLLASTVSKLSATAIQNDARPWEYVELVYIGLTRAAVLASAALTTDSFPKYVAGGILAADIAALSAQSRPVVRAVLHNLGSTGAALYLGGLANVQEERSFGAAALFLVSTVLHALSATQ